VCLRGRRPNSTGALGTGSTMADRKPKQARRSTGKPVPSAHGRAQAKAPKPKAAKPAKAPRPTSGTFDALVPSLAVEDAPKAIDWYKRAFGVREVDRRLAPDGKVVHAELALGGGRLYLFDVPGTVTEHPVSLGGTTVRLHLQVEQVDRAFARAVAEGAAVLVPLADQAWGDRFGVLRDPFGHVWSMSWLATRPQ
jgi:PhnB protein